MAEQTYIRSYPQNSLHTLLLLGALAGCGVGAITSSHEEDARPDAGPPSSDAGSTPSPDAAPPSPDAAPPAPDAAPPGEVWRPSPGTSWQWQLTGSLDTSLDVDMYDIDLFDNSTSAIAGLKADGRIVICYFSAGSREDWRPDADDFPASVIGDPLDGWDGECWLDIRSAAVRDIMRARLDLAASKGCDGVEPDNVDGYTNSPGFPLTAQDQLDYNRFLAAEAHARGLSIGLKNDVDQVNALVDDFDWALNEECFQYHECDMLEPFVAAGKAVFSVEYGSAGTADSICPQANALDFDTLIKHLDLDAWRIACR